MHPYVPYGPSCPPYKYVLGHDLTVFATTRDLEAMASLAVPCAQPDYEVAIGCRNHNYTPNVLVSPAPVRRF